jgi:hypothetical protein
MRSFSKLLIGAAALAGAGAGIAAVHNTHVMTVRLPGGGVERISAEMDREPRPCWATPTRC